VVTVNWKGKMVFEADPPTGNKFTMDAHPESGGENHGPTPVETLLGAVAACGAMDVIAILEKKRQKVDSYRIEVDGTRPPQGEYPRPFLTMSVKHVVRGENIDPAALKRAVELSDEKYCSVLATLRSSPKITSEWEIEE
jgi:putative redox protein